MYRRGRKTELTVEIPFKDVQEFNRQVEHYEKLYNAKLIQAEIREGKAYARFVYPIGRLDSEEVVVNVWNCQSELYIGRKSEKHFDFTNEQKEALETWKAYVIYTVNGGAINWSGNYLPSPFAVDLLKRILAGDVEAVAEISEPTEEDYRGRAEIILGELDSGRLKGVEVYNSIIRCFDGCQGYHYTQWIEYHNGQYNKYITGCHHATMRGMWDKTLSETLTREEALQEIVEWLKALAQKYDWTRAELKEADLSYQYESP